MSPVLERSRSLVLALSGRRVNRNRHFFASLGGGVDALVVDPADNPGGVVNAQVAGEGFI